MKDTLSER